MGTPRGKGWSGTQAIALRGLWTSTGGRNDSRHMLSVQTPLRRFLALLACAIVGVAGVKPCAAAAGWSISVSPDDALYPVLDLSQRAGKPGEARYGDGSGMIAVEVVAQSANEAVHLSVSTAALAELAKDADRFDVEQNHDSVQPIGVAEPA